MRLWYRNINEIKLRRFAVIAKGGTLPNTGVTKNQVYALVDNATLSAVVDDDITSVGGSKFVSLSGIPSAAGKIPVANIDTGTTANKIVILDGSAKLPAVDGSQLTGIGPILYPIGCIYISTVSTNPATVFGFGTWEAFGKGQVLIGKADSGTFVTAGATGGEETHTLITSEMPAHTHSAARMTGTGGGAFGWLISWLNGNGTAGSDFETNSTGGDGAHNNLQPYIVVYMWKRTA